VIGKMELHESLSEFVFDKDYDVVDVITIKDSDLLIAKHKRDTIWLVGEMAIMQFETSITTEKRFNIYFKITLDIENIRGRRLGYDKMMQVRGVSVRESHQGYKLSQYMYKWLINKYNFVIIGDREQYFGARKLWARLSQEIDVTVDIVDLNKMEIVKENVVLHHGNYDEDFGKEIWSYDASKEHIRLVLKNITKG
jgi:hypothetical protein